MNAEQMQAIHDRLWQFRREMADVWPTPDTLDSLRFAVTEAGEAMDAYLRTKGGYARNNAKEPDLLGELADCAMMLMTALGPEWGYDDWGIEVGYADLAEIVISVGDCLACWGEEPCSDSSIGAECTLFDIADYAGMDLAAELSKRMERILEHGAHDGGASQAPQRRAV